MLPKVAIVILNWNGKHFLERFLQLLINRTPEEYAQIIVADNGSTDGSVEYLRHHFPGLRLIVFPENNGYTGGYNRALGQIEAPYYVLLNSDVEVLEGWLPPLVRAMDNHPEIGVCMPRILSWTKPSHFEYAGACGGFIDRYGFPFCRGRILSHIEEDKGQYNNPIPVFWASGTCMMVRSELFHRLGGLDNAFFAHMEEIDFCWRVQWAGSQVWVIPQSAILHVGGGTLPNNSPRKLFLNYRNNLYMLYKNLPNRKLVPLFILRFFLDYMTAVAYFIQGKSSFSISVFKAHRAFLKGYRQLTRVPSHDQHKMPRGIYKGSIVFRFFLSFRRPVFSTLRWK